MSRVKTHHLQQGTNVAERCCNLSLVRSQPSQAPGLVFGHAQVDQRGTLFS